MSVGRSSSRRTKWLAVGVAVAGVAATVALISRPSGGEPVTATPACRLAAPPSAASVEDASGIRTVEQGYSKTGPKASMGVLLRNETGKVAYRTLVTFDAVDSAGRSVVHDSHQRFRTQVVPTILPGATVAVGLASLLDDATLRGENQLTSMKVEIGVQQWLAPGDGNNGLGEVTATVVAGSGRRQADGRGSLVIDVESANCDTPSQGLTARMVSRGVSLVFRDGSGAVVGGSLDNIPRNVCGAGRTDGQRTNLTDRDIPVQADLNKTLATAYCDFDRRQAPSASATPYN